MKKAKRKFKYQRRPFRYRESKDFIDLEVGLIYPDGDDDEDYRTNPNLNREEIKAVSMKNQLK
ncbi:MAG TPA: hypothetical protein VIK96_00580 [Bacilli bacterium]